MELNFIYIYSYLPIFTCPCSFFQIFPIQGSYAVRKCQELSGSRVRCQEKSTSGKVSGNVRILTKIVLKYEFSKQKIIFTAFCNIKSPYIYYHARFNVYSPLTIYMCIFFSKLFDFYVTYYPMFFGLLQPNLKLHF